MRIKEDVDEKLDVASGRDPRDRDRESDTKYGRDDAREPRYDPRDRRDYRKRDRDRGDAGVWTFSF